MECMGHVTYVVVRQAQNYCEGHVNHSSFFTPAMGTRVMTGLFNGLGEHGLIPKT